MSKRELMDRIIQINRSARPEFLQQFSETELDEYLRQLESIGRKDRSCAIARGN